MSTFTMDTIGYLTKQEVEECLNDIKIFSAFATFTINGKEEWNSQEILSDSIIRFTGEYGIFYRDGDVVVSLRSLFNSHLPYQNTLDSFKKVAPEWFVEKYTQKNEGWKR